VLPLPGTFSCNNAISEAAAVGASSARYAFLANDTVNIGCIGAGGRGADVDEKPGGGEG